MYLPHFGILTHYFCSKRQVHMKWIRELKDQWMLYGLRRKHEWLKVSEEISPDRRIKRLRCKLRKVEQRILRITGENPDKATWRRSQKQTERVCKLISDRCYLLNQLFAATPAEVERMELVNARLYDLTKKMYRRSAEIYRQLLTQPRTEDFDDDIHVEGTLKFSRNDRSSVLELENDAYYGSDFYRMFSVIDWLFSSEYSDWNFGIEELESCGKDLELSDTPDMTDKELGFDDWSDDGTTWAEGWLRNPAMEHICLCHAVHDTCIHKHYSIPDLLRMNDFWCEVTVKHQHIVEQDGHRMGWWEDCSYEEFRDKFYKEAEHRPSRLRFGQFIFNRAAAIFPDEADTLHGGVHDCFYDDAKVDDYLQAIYDKLQNNL